MKTDLTADELPLLAAAGAAGRGRIAAVFLLSLSSLLLELGLTRLFSVVLFYHFAFMAISVALLGLGAGGLAAFFRRAKLQSGLQQSSRPGRRADRDVTKSCWCSGAASVLALALILRSQISLDVSGAVFWRLAAIYVVAALPFFFNGFVFSLVMSEYAGEVHRIYFADLAGAAAACLSLVPLMNVVGGPSVIFASSALAIAAGLLFARAGRQQFRYARRGVPIVLVLLGIATVGDAHGRFFDVKYAKGMERRDIEYKRWNSFSRVEVRGGAYKDILIDADADTAIVGASKEQVETSPKMRGDFMRYTAALPYVLRPGGRVLIIGPGGGSDVMRALLEGSRDITAAEINPIIVRDIMQRRYAGWSHGLYLLPEVHAVVAEGRSYVRRSRSTYDVLQATMVDTWASTAAGALSLSENNLYTVEAFREYLRHLDEDGVLSLTRWEFAQPREALRVVSLAMTALNEEFGVTDPGRYVAVVSDGPLNTFGVTVTTLIRRRPYTQAEARLLTAYVNTHPPMQVQYLPGQTEQNAYSALLASRNATEFSSTYPFDVSPTTDDRPFFFYTVKTGEVLGLPGVHVSSGGRSMDWKNNLALFLLLSILVISVVAVLVFLVLPLVLTHASADSGLAYFIALGLGYILVEIALIQRFVLFLGHPTYALTVVIFLLLASSSMGSLIGPRLGGPVARARWSMLGIIALTFIYRYLGVWLGALVGLPLPVKITLAALLIIPLGFLMGIPFPAGIAWLNARAAGKVNNAVEWAWALNAGASVLGSVLAIFIAIHFGMSVALLTGGVAYLLAMISSLQQRVGPKAALVGSAV